jgi:hypothetical protein
LPLAVGRFRKPRELTLKAPLLAGLRKSSFSYLFPPVLMILVILAILVIWGIPKLIAFLGCPYANPKAGPQSRPGESGSPALWNACRFLALSRQALVHIPKLNLWLVKVTR